MNLRQKTEKFKVHLKFQSFKIEQKSRQNEMSSAEM